MADVKAATAAVSNVAQVVVVIGSGPLPTGVTKLIAADARVIAADSGLDHALAAGLRPDSLIGDLDSISTTGRSWAAEHRVTTAQHPADKDTTDTALALSAAAATGASTLLVLGGAGDRLDHVIGTVIALGASDLGSFERVTAVLGATTVHTVHPGRRIRLDIDTGSTFSVLALHGPCTEVEVTGAAWPLRDASIQPSATIGISNVVVRDTQIAVGTGVLTVVVP